MLHADLGAANEVNGEAGMMLHDECKSMVDAFLMHPLSLDSFKQVWQSRNIAAEGQGLAAINALSNLLETGFIEVSIHPLLPPL